MKKFVYYNLDTHKNNGQLRYRARRRLKEDINHTINKYGFFWNRSRLARKHNVSHTTVNRIADEIITKRKELIKSIMITRIERERSRIATEVTLRSELKMPNLNLLKRLRKYSDKISKILYY